MTVSLKKPSLLLLSLMLMQNSMGLLLTPVPRWTSMLFQRSRACSLKNIVEGYQVKCHRLAWIGEIEKASRKIESDATGREYEQLSH